MGLIGLNANGYQGMNNWTSGQSVRNNTYAKLQADQIELKEACKEYIANGGTQAEFENTYSEEIEAWKAAYEAYTSGADETSYESTGINAELKTHKDTLKNNPHLAGQYDANNNGRVDDEDAYLYYMSQQDSAELSTLGLEVERSNQALNDYNDYIQNYAGGDQNNDGVVDENDAYLGFMEDNGNSYFGTLEIGFGTDSSGNDAIIFGDCNGDNKINGQTLFNLDTDGDGTLSKSEFEAYLANQGELTGKVKCTNTALDTDGDGYLSLNEFRNYAVSEEHKAIAQGEITEKGGTDNKINFEEYVQAEIKDAIKARNDAGIEEDMTDAELQELIADSYFLFKGIDADDNGIIDEAELTKFYQKLDNHDSKMDGVYNLDAANKYISALQDKAFKNTKGEKLEEAQEEVKEIFDDVKTDYETLKNEALAA